MMVRGSLMGRWVEGERGLLRRRGVLHEWAMPDSLRTRCSCARRSSRARELVVGRLGVLLAPASGHDTTHARTDRGKEAACPRHWQVWQGVREGRSGAKWCRSLSHHRSNPVSRISATATSVCATRPQLLVQEQALRANESEHGSLSWGLDVCLSERESTSSSADSAPCSACSHRTPSFSAGYPTSPS